MLFSRNKNPSPADLTSLFRAVEAYLQVHYMPPQPVYRSMCEKAEDRCMPPAAACVRPAKARQKSLTERLADLDAGFSETLLKLIDQSGQTDAQVYKSANLSKQHFSKIRNNPQYRPTKPTALALAVALHLDLEQTRDLIGRAGYFLSNSSKFDVIIRYFLEQKNYDLFQINETLYEFDQPLLGM